MTTVSPSEPAIAAPTSPVHDICRDAIAICDTFAELNTKLSSLLSHTHATKTWSIQKGFLDCVQELQTITWHLTVIENDMVDLLPNLPHLRDATEQFARRRGVNITPPRLEGSADDAGE